MHTKPRLAIVGAGLGGCFLADRLAASWDVVCVELTDTGPFVLQQRVRDEGLPAITHPHIGAGLGGTTAFWHNGLIEIDAPVFERCWPYAKRELDRYYEQVYPQLAGVPCGVVRQATAALRGLYEAAGVPASALGRHGLFYPRTRINAWQRLGLADRVKLIRGEVTALVPDGGRIVRIDVRQGDRCTSVDADVFVLAAGGLGTPLLLQDLRARAPGLPALAQAGLHYEDHPTAAVGEVTLDEPLYRLWNFPVRGARGNLRLPMVIEQDGLQISFQLRPSAQFRGVQPAGRVRNLLNDLRNEPLKLRSYLLLLTHWDDVLEILSFKLGVRLPTRRYTIVMVAEQPAIGRRDVWSSDGGRTIHRGWHLSGDYLDALQRAIDRFISVLGAKVSTSQVFPGWRDELMSSSHHSGTARMTAPGRPGVCDGDGRVHGLSNLFVCDGALIPGSGFANTGLTIAALGTRLADRLQVLQSEILQR